MKRIVWFFVLSLIIVQLNAFDFNGMWSSRISTEGHTKLEYEYSWGTVQEPSDIGFSIDLKKGIIHTNCVWSFLIDLDYNDDTKTFSFTNPITKEKEIYYVTVISDYEIKLETEYYSDRDPLINASKKDSEDKVHYFKIAGPKNAKVLEAPVKAKLLYDIELKFLDYQGIVHNLGLVRKGTIVEVVDYYEEFAPDITDIDFNYHILINSTRGGCVDPRAIEFIDDITINGYGGKQNIQSPKL